ncbi:MAG: MFS transporter [Pseudomonadota bacterium]
MNKRALAVIIAGFFTVFTAFGVRYVYGILLPEMLPALAISKTQAGVIFSSFLITYTVFSPILGVMTDRYDVRIILSLFVVFLGAGALLMSFATTVLNASLFFSIAGFGHAACWVPVVTLIQRWVPDNRRGVALAFTDLGSASGIAVWSLVMPSIVAHYTWRAGWMSLGLSAFLVAGMNFFLVRSQPEERKGAQSETATPLLREPVRVTYKKVFHDRNFWLLGVSYFFLGSSIIIPFTFLSTYAVTELRWSYETASRLIAVIAVAGMFGKLLLGHLSDILGRVRIMMVCGVLVASGCLGIARSADLLTIGAFTALFGLGYGAIWPVYAAAVRDFFQKESAGSVMGLWTFFLGIGTTLSPVLSGWTIDRMGTYMTAFMLAFAGGVISLLLLLPIALSPDRR